MAIPVGHLHWLEVETRMIRFFVPFYDNKKIHGVKLVSIY